MNLEGRLLGNRYEMIENVGNGGMATVYRAKDHVLNRDVAVKVLRDEFTTDNEFVKRFNAESQSAARAKVETSLKMFIRVSSENWADFSNFVPHFCYLKIWGKKQAFFYPKFSYNFFGEQTAMAGCKTSVGKPPSHPLTLIGTTNNLYSPPSASETHVFASFLQR